jgi:hypothetical protein
MAGFFPDVPGTRFEYDRDGSVVVYQSGGPVTASTGQMQEINDEDNTDAFTLNSVVGIAWPEHRTVTGIYLAKGSGGLPGAITVDQSTNTTNGVDGTWTSLTSITPDVIASGSPIQIAERCRSAITLVTATGVTGLKFTYDSFTYTQMTIHIYGNYSLTENPDRLILCDASGAVVTNGAFFDFGDAPRSTTATKSFRIKNNSASFTANSIALSFQTLYDASPSLSTQFQYSFDGGGSWVATGNIGNLAPGATSSTIQIRRNTLPGAAVGPWQSRVVAVPASMT